MAHASGLALTIDLQKVPFLKGAASYAARGAFAGGLRDNRSYFGPGVQFSDSVDLDHQMMLFDPQTSGGLLLGVPRNKIDRFLQRAAELHQPAWVIGTARTGAGIRVE
jgi:selenide,water dikinase